MVKQGDIIKINFDPQKGHEQSGCRPAVIISNNIFNTKARLVIALPITNNSKDFPLHVPLDSRTITTGKVLCEHIKSLDLNSRSFELIEQIPHDLLLKIIAMVKAEIKII